MNRTGWISISVLLGLWAGGYSHLLGESTPAKIKRPASAPRAVDFAATIRPILAARCLTCHGPDKQRGGLRLDREAAALRGGDAGPAFVPGNSGTSEMVRRVTCVDADERMPPQGERLTAKEVELLRAWIDQGAKWLGEPNHDADQTAVHWAFQPLRRPAVPSLATSNWPRNPVDAFILEKLQKEGVTPAPEADRPTLARRLHLDLLGLPPLPNTLGDFLTDPRPDAYERLVERLLASPHFGERWGRHWLDLARYADSDGYEKDLPRPYAWRWRDWVIDAMNSDMPFDQFTVEQLAGDLLPHATTAQRVATGFHRNTLTNREGGVDQEEYRARAVVDRVNTTASVWLGLTLACAECHSHKYDPITQREYYGMYAFFNDADETEIEAPTVREQHAYNHAQLEHEKKLQSARQSWATALAAAADRQMAWENQARGLLAHKEDGLFGAWHLLPVATATNENGIPLRRLPDQGLVATGKATPKDTYSIVFHTSMTRITGLRLEVTQDGSLPRGGPGRGQDGSFVLSELVVEASPRHDANARQAVSPTVAAKARKSIVFNGALAEREQPGFPVLHAIDNNPKTGWAIGPSTANQHATRTAYFIAKDPFGFDNGTTIKVTLKQLHGQKNTLGRFRLAWTDAGKQNIPRIPSEQVKKYLALQREQRTPEQQEAIQDYFRKVDETLSRAYAELEKVQAEKPAIPTTKAQALRAASKTRPTHIHLRGDFLSRGDKVEPHTPAVLPPLTIEKGIPPRLALARWLVAPMQPLTPRVTVNRIWHHLFGRGLTTTLDDFGTQGEPPTHPALLNWLACEYQARQWSTKSLIRLLVTSATYRQASNHRAELQERDPKNTWLARQNRYRLEGEVIRDLSLAASGMLHAPIGGPSVRPPLPAGIAELGYANSIRWPESSGSDKYRRGMYIFFQRTTPYPMLMTFDAPDSNICCTRRERSNTPLQALTLLNDPVFYECARSLGKQLASDAEQSAEHTIQWGFRRCLGRDPQSGEQKRLMRLYSEAHRHFLNFPAEAQTLVGKANLSHSQFANAAAWIVLARTLLNVDEFYTRE